MKHTMSTPCPECPFRNDLPNGYLRPERVQEIAESLFRGGSFPCHKTTVSVEDEDGFGDRELTDDSVQCAGAEIFLAKQGHSTQMGRIAERLGLAATLDMDAPVCGSVSEMLEVHGYEPEGEPCSVCDDDCEAPAGMLIDGGIVDGTETAEFECCWCGQPVCGACSREHEDGRICNHCEED